MAYTRDDKLRDCRDAFDKSSRYFSELRQIYKYFMPWREPLSERSGTGDGGQRTEGAPLITELYDSTGMASAFAFAANTQADWLPAFEDFFKLEPGPLWNSPGDNGQRARDLEIVGKIVHALTQPIRATSSTFFQDTFAGEAHMFLDKGPKNRAPIRAMIAPPLEMATVNGPYEDIERWFWKRTFRARHLEEKFPEMRPSDRLARLIREKKDDPLTVIQYTWWDEKAERYQFEAFLEIDDSKLRVESYRTCPWISPRILTIPGESRARGLGHIGLPNARTLNTSRQLALRAAAFALLGLWTRRNDGVFNPETAQMAPGRMWKVAYNGGPLGKTIERLDVPHNFDVSSIVTADEREQLKRVLLDDELPEVTDRVRSPTEIAGRMRRYNRNRGGSTVRLAQELVVPFVQRSIDICEQHGYLPGTTTIDQILTKATLTAPAAAAQQSGKVERTVSWVQMIVGLLGPQAALLAAEVEALVPQLGRWMGVEEAHIRSKAGVKELQGLIAKIIAEMQMAEQQAKAKPPPEAQVPQMKPEAMFMNGGGA